MKPKKATFGAGCFWHVEESFRKVKGVTKTTVGYMGGTTQNPTYQEVCSNTTGHIEVCQVEFDPDVVSYDELLNVFYKMHDPTQMNRQGLDIGIQYKSAIFFHTKDQERSAIASKEKEQKNHKKKIATEIIPAQEFYEAEEYHQKYLMKRGRNTCYG